MNLTPKLKLPVLAAGEENTTGFDTWQKAVNQDSESSAFYLIDHAFADAQDAKERSVIFSAEQPAVQAENDIWNKILIG